MDYLMNPKHPIKMRKEQQVQEAENWLTQNARTPWAKMRLELMEERKPEELEEMLKSETLLPRVMEWEKELTERHMEMMRSGEYNSPQEIGDVMRGELIAESEAAEWSVEELLDRALYQNEVLTKAQKDFLRENLPPQLAREVDLLP